MHGCSRYRQRQAHGLCVWCGTSAVPGHNYCEAHREYFRQRYAASRAATHGPVIACPGCFQWIRIVQIPMRTPCCNRMVLQQVEETG